MRMNAKHVALMSVALSWMICGCDDGKGDDGKGNEEFEACTSDVDCAWPDYLLDRGCFVIDGKSVCKDACNSKGNHEPVCYYYWSDPQPFPMHSGVETCVADDNGKLYMTDIQMDNCQYGCDEETGLCKEEKPDLHCCYDMPLGDRTYICVSVSGQESCEFTCLVDSAGKHDPMCYSYVYAPYMSVVEECALDDYGQLYSVHTQDHSCDNGCNFATGLCNDEDPEKECTEDVECAWPDYFLERGCFVIKGKSVCQDACTSKGNHEAVCYWFWDDPEPYPMHSAVETCVADDNGKLYMTGVNMDNCDYGCDEGTGLCKDGPVTECKKNCSLQGGDPRVCVVLSGKEECKTACFGKAEGKNEPVCYQNASVGPEAPYYSVVDTCAIDDVGTLYSLNAAKTKCSQNCNEATGLCSKEGPVKECQMDCTLDGGDPQVCIKIDGKESCATACFGKTEGVNKPVCYQNTSIGPEAPYYSVVDTCATDDLGTLYSKDDKRTKCDNGCDETTGNCNPSKPPVEDCSTLDCLSVGGRAMTCVMLSGKPNCKDTCLASSAGVNKPVCYKNASLGPAAKYYSAVDTCEKDDDGKLYSVSTDMTECPGECEKGVCK